MKKYYYFRIVLQPQGKIVKDAVYYCTKERMHEISFDICNKMNNAGLTFNGRNAHHYYDLETIEVPSPDELSVINKL